MIISRTPVRISFFGGGSDYREFYLRNHGAVIGTTINKYVYVSLNRLSSIFDYKIRVGYSKSELINSVDEIIHPSVRACLKFKKVDGYLDIHIFSDLPAKTGLGSSSSFTVGFLNALYALDGKMVSRHILADEARHIEQDLIGENVGSQDQFHAAHGGLNIIEFGEDGIKVRPVIITKEKKAILENSIMVFYTGINRYASEVVEEQVNNTRNGSRDKYINRMYDMVFEAEKTLSDDSPQTMVRNFAELMNEGWELKKQLSTKVTNSKVDEIYMLAKDAGAYGGKLSGAGGGGFMTFLVDPSRQDSVRKALANLLEVKCRLTDEGSAIIYLKN